jgi:hypothetical protein
MLYNQCYHRQLSVKSFKFTLLFLASVLEVKRLNMGQSFIAIYTCAESTELVTHAQIVQCTTATSLLAVIIGLHTSASVELSVLGELFPL